VTVGVVLVDLATPSAPTGVRDSKLLTPAARERLVPRLMRWAPAWSVAHASAAEIDAVGILRALRLAGERAFAALPHRPDHVLLDGSYDWVSRPAPALFDDDGGVSDPDQWLVPPPVTMRIKADLSCSSVAAASVLAKTTRDALMVGMSARFPAYGWDVNKGYASPEHLDALRAVGPCDEHRRSWAIPGGRGEELEPDDVTAALLVGGAPADLRGVLHLRQDDDRVAAQALPGLATSEGR
jgi:ribonuclease HII